jgi:3-oxoadipate enol-lactonase
VVTSPATVEVAGPGGTIECLVTHQSGAVGLAGPAGSARSARSARLSSRAPTTLFVPALASSIADTLPLGSAVGGTRVFVQLRGHGGTAMPTDAAGRPLPGDLADLVEDLRAVLAETGARRAVGVSLGAAALLRLVVESPAALDRLVLVLPPDPIRPVPRQLQARFEAMATAAERAEVEVLAGLLRDRFPAAISRRPAVRLWSRRHAAWLTAPPVAASVAAALRRYPTGAALTRWPDPAGTPVLPEVTLPVLVLAQLDDPWHPVAAARSIAGALPVARLQVLPAGAVPWGEPALVRGSIAGFLD